MATTSANSQELVEVEEVRDGTLVLKDGSLRQVIMVGGLNFDLKSDEEQGAITQGYQNFLNSLDFSIQIIIHSRKINIEKYLATLEARKNQEISGLLRDQISEYQEFIRGFIKEYAVMRKQFLVVIPYTSASLPGRDTLSRLSPFKKKEAKPTAEKTDPQREAEFKEGLGQLTQRVQETVDGLRTIGLEVTVLSDDELIELFYNFYNPETIEKENLPLPESPMEPSSPAASPSASPQSPPATSPPKAV